MQCITRLIPCRDAFSLDNLILHPRSFQPSSTALTWLNAESCVWRGPEGLLDKTPLASALAYRNNEKLKLLFCGVLGIKNANWHDYMEALLRFRNIQNSPHDLGNKLQELYDLLSKCRLSEEEWRSIK
jgi:hypothetical protein